MAISYVDAASGMQRGVAEAETGIKIDTFTTSADNPREYSMNEDGQYDGFAHFINPSLTFNVTGEIAGSTGLAAIKFGTAITLANIDSAKLADTASTFWGIADTGDVLLETAEISEGRQAWKTLTATMTRHPLITIA